MNFFVNICEKILKKKLNFSRSALLDIKTRVCLKHLVNSCSIGKLILYFGSKTAYYAIGQWSFDIFLKFLNFLRLYVFGYSVNHETTRIYLFLANNHLRFISVKWKFSKASNSDKMIYSWLSANFSFAICIFITSSYC